MWNKFALFFLLYESIIDTNNYFNHSKQIGNRVINKYKKTGAISSNGTHLEIKVFLMNITLNTLIYTLTNNIR